MKVINTFILLWYNNLGDNMKKGYIISIGILIITLIIGIMIIKSNNKLVYTKKDLVEYNTINKRIDEINKDLKVLKKKQIEEYDNNGESKRYFNLSTKIDKLNSEKANLDMDLDALDRNKIINYKKMMPGVLLIIFGIVISSLIFVKSKKLEDN